VKSFRDLRHITLDVEHMRRLHQEAIEQLELMRTSLDAAEQAIGTIRDKLETMFIEHWNGYLDVLHMLIMHDEAMAAVINKYGMPLRDDNPMDDIDTPHLGHPSLLLLLVTALIRHHRRFCDIYGWRGNPMSDYLKESMTMEREHIAELISMIQQTL